ncbi:hypothetical protein HHL14_04810 [Paraburkholderia sp. G-4-1-8]|uniref:Uncharacterized protein n=1 Tax=Paraburkholderia antibiotica TaxID=2728839 RepID=A0A7X9X2B6_9BURK|nr:hypothetical protein [Paraburkholderia antibiotica]NML30149.1 hypothetical protein [Paraburkholderia antibiotica]
MLLDLEETSIFADRPFFKDDAPTPIPFGIYKRVDFHSKSGWRKVVKLRFLMPAVALLFALFFLVMFIGAGFWGKGSDDSSRQPQICIAESSCPAGAGGPAPVANNGTLILAERFPVFEKGLYRMDCGTDEARAKLARIHDAIAHAVQGRMKSVVFLIGSTDRTPLTKKFAAQFESNSALASARVATVETCLRATFAADKPLLAPAPEIERFVSGPHYIANPTGPDRDAESLMAADRNVNVLVLGFPVSEPAQSAP